MDATTTPDTTGPFRLEPYGDGFRAVAGTERFYLGDSAQQAAYLVRCLNAAHEIGRRAAYTRVRELLDAPRPKIGEDDLYISAERDLPTPGPTYIGNELRNRPVAGGGT